MMRLRKLFYVTSKRQTQTRPRHAVISNPVGGHPTGIGEDADIRGETKFQVRLPPCAKPASWGSN